MKLKSFNKICEDLKIVKKNWKFADTTNQGYLIEINDSPEHSILQRIKTRTNVKINDMNSKLQKGIDLILRKASKDKFNREINYIELTYTQSNFKAVFMIKPKSKYIRISSIFEISFDTKNALQWDINEFIKECRELQSQVLNESENICFYIIDNNDEDSFYSVEINEYNKSYDVYLSDPNSIPMFNINL